MGRMGGCEPGHSDRAAAPLDAPAWLVTTSADLTVPISPKSSLMSPEVTPTSRLATLILAPVLIPPLCFSVAFLVAALLAVAIDESVLP